jgi:hypothetical protein
MKKNVHFQCSTYWFTLALFTHAPQGFTINLKKINALFLDVATNVAIILSTHMPPNGQIKGQHKKIYPFKVISKIYLNTFLNPNLNPQKIKKLPESYEVTYNS